MHEKPKAQLVLPLGLDSIRLPAAIVFHTPDKKEERHVALRKAVGWQICSHREILRENLEAVTKGVRDWTDIWERVGPLMEADPVLTLAQALARLCEGDRGAA